MYTVAKYEDLYAFSYNPKQNDAERLQGWELIGLAEEYQRMGVPNANWQLSDANRGYKVPIFPSGGSQNTRYRGQGRSEQELLLFLHLVSFRDF